MVNEISRNRIGKFATIPCGMIQAGSFELRSKKKGIRALRESIRTNGLLVPISLLKVEGAYVVVDGMRRLVAWSEEYPDQPIPAVLLNYPEEMGAVNEGRVSNNEQAKRDAYTANLSRLKVSKEKVEAYVSELHSQGMGYKAIADCIGYKKSGIQKMIARLEAGNQEHSSDAYMSKKKTANKIKRMRTSLGNLLNDLEGATDEETKIFRRIDEILKAHEEFYVEELEKSLSKD